MNGNWLLIVIVLFVLSLVARCDVAQSLATETAATDRPAEKEVRP